MLPYHCPNSQCLSHKTSSQIVRDGSFFRPSDGRKIQRYRCKLCKRRFSSATFEAAYRQNKRRVNFPLRGLLCSNVSIRRAAILLNIDKKTVSRKLKFLGAVAKNKFEIYVSNLKKVEHIQFDDLHAIEHTKCKPLSVTMAVEVHSRKILGLEVSSMPATGHLAKIARKKYGYRPDHRKKNMEKLFKRLQKLLKSDCVIHSDEHPFYEKRVRKYFPKARYNQFKGAKSCIAGQGELKKLRFDPLFSINHTFGMLRANINRLIRRSWCTTKDPERLKDHLYLYANFHNEVLVS